jgi:hypothetical protein
MAAQKKLTMTTPEPTEDKTLLKLTRVEVDFSSGEVTGVCVKYNAGETESNGERYTFTMTDAAVLKIIEDHIMTEGQSEGALPAGTIADA